MIDLDSVDLSKLSYREKAELLRLLEEKERRNLVGGHLVKMFPDEGPYSWKKYPRHMQFIEAGKRHRERFFMGANRCLAEGTLVATPKGPVAIEDINVGDYVYDRYGKPTKVISTWDNGLAETVSMQNRRKEYFRCTPNHELDVYLPKYRDNSRKFSPENYSEGRCEAGNLCNATKVRREYVKSPLGNVNFKEAYALGAILGDGCCRQSTTNRLAVSSQDSKVPEKILECLDGESLIPPHPKNYTWNIVAQWPEHYKEWCHGKYAHEKIVDLDVIKTWDRESVLNFVAGLIDTDGCLIKAKDGYTFSLSMQALPVIEAFAWCVLALWQEPVTISTDNRAKYVNGPVYEAKVRNPWTVWRICEELEPYVQHKYKCDLGNFDNVGSRSFPNCMKLSPKKGKLERVYDITVAHPEHMFLLANGFSVSNSGKTQLGCFELSCHLTGQYPSWWVGRTFDHPIDAWAASETNVVTRDILQEKLLGQPGQFGTGLIAAELLANVRMKPGVPDAVESCKIKHVSNGWSHLQFKSYDQGRKTFQGTSRHVVLLDEEPGYDIYSECLVRTMTVDGMVMVTATPLKGLTQFVQEYLDTAEKPHTDEEVYV